MAKIQLIHDASEGTQFTIDAPDAKFKCGRTKIQILYKKSDRVDVIDRNTKDFTVAMFEHVNFGEYNSLYRNASNMRLSVAAAILSRIGGIRAIYEAPKQPAVRAKIVKLADAIDHIFGLPGFAPDMHLTYVRNYFKNNLNRWTDSDARYGDVRINSIDLNGTVLKIDVEFFKKAYGDGYDDHYSGSFPVNHLSSYGDRGYTSGPPYEYKNANWTAKGSDISSTVLEALFTYKGSGEIYTNSTVALLCDRIEISEYISAD